MENKPVTINYIRLDGFEKPTDQLENTNIKKYFGFIVKDYYSECIPRGAV